MGEDYEKRATSKVAKRFVGLLIVCYFVAYLDRVNVGFAKLTMDSDLGISDTAFGFGAGIFFLTYFLFEVPSNLLFERFGARLWIARIMFSWGLISGAMAFIPQIAAATGLSRVATFYLLRLLLGFAEAGFFPGIIFFLTLWVPSAYRARIIGYFMAAIPLSSALGTPVSAQLMELNGVAGFAGWQWLFIMEALPAIVMAVVMFQMLTDRPAEATWLRPDQRTWLVERIASERAQQEAVRKFSLAGAFSSRTLWLITIAYFGNQMWSYAVSFFLPLIVRGLGVGTNWIGLLSGLPYLVALVAMNVWGWNSDRTGERTWHVASAWLLSSAGMAVCILVGPGSPSVVMVGLTFAAMGPWAMAPAFWALPSALLTGTAAAGGIAMIGAVGQLGSWFGPTLFGLVKDATGSNNTALLVLALAPVISTVLLVAAGHDRRMERIPSRG